MARHSGLQKQVLGLYRRILRVASEKDRSLVATAATATAPSSSSSSSSTTASSEHVFASARKDTNSSTWFARQEFRKQASQVQRNDFKKIEYMIRKGEKHLKLLNMPGVNTIGGT